MNDLKKFLKGVPTALWISLISVVVLICIFPILFTQSLWIDFTDTGQIGDTIGGIMGPFVAIVAAFLTFIAFWAQFDANRELIKENRRNHFENRFYKMLDIHIENVTSMNSRFEENKYSSCFQKWCYEITNLCNQFRFQGDQGGLIDELRNSLIEDSNSQEFRSWLLSIKSSSDDYEKVIFEIAYTYFLTSNTSTLKYGDKQQTSFVLKYSSFLLADLVDKYKSTVVSNKNELLGRYYRHLFQIVSFVDKQPDNLFDEEGWKEDYLSILRSQMSDYEQMLLYYNAQSSHGKAWDERHYIEKYKMIKNIPYLDIAFSVGVRPVERYDKAIRAAEAKGEKFFERM